MKIFTVMEDCSDDNSPPNTVSIPRRHSCSKGAAEMFCVQAADSVISTGDPYICSSKKPVSSRLPVILFNTGMNVQSLLLCASSSSTGRFQSSFNELLASDKKDFSSDSILSLCR